MIYCKDFKETDRKYKYFIRTYYTLNDLINLIDILKENYLLHYAIIEHNKEGENHCHCILTFKQPISAKNIYTRLDLISELDSQNTEFEIPISIKNCFEYLTHQNDIDKYQYSKDDIFCDNIHYFNKMLNDNQNKQNIEFMEDLIELDYMSMAIKYGRDYIKNYSAYNSFKQLILSNERNLD